MIRETEYGWVDLSNLVYKNGFIDWISSYGRTIPFKYKNVEGEIVLKEKINERSICIDIPGYVENRTIGTPEILQNKLGSCVKVITSDYRYDINDVVGNILILNRYKFNSKNNHHKYYRCKCLIDGYEWDLREDHLRNGVSCPICSGYAVMRGVNDLGTKRPDLVRFFNDPEVAYKVSCYGHRTVELKCPNCNSIKEVFLNNLCTNGFSCPYCSDGLSYPNKFVRNFLKQILSDDKIKNEHFFSWSKHVPVSWSLKEKKMIYDIYLPDHNIIIENHGEQHYRPTGFNSRADKPFWKTQENDLVKKNIAIQNGIKHYIELDCRVSDKEFIKNSIMNSNLPALLGFDEQDIDWNSCDKYASGSLLVNCCDLWNNGYSNIKQIANIIGVHRGTVTKYISKGRKLGLIQDN